MAKLKYGTYHRAKVGSKVSGDAYLVKEYDERILVCLVDGLGSGPLAAKAAQTAIDWTAEHYQTPLTYILAGCHEAMRGTRGAVMALVRIDMEQQQLFFVGVGNIEFHAWSAEPMHPVSYNGIVGSRLPTLREFGFAYTPNDLIILHTDGISRQFVQDGLVEQIGPASPQRLAEAIAKDYAKRTDDVTLIVLSSVSYPDIKTKNN